MPLAVDTQSATLYSVWSHIVSSDVLNVQTEDSSTCDKLDFRLSIPCSTFLMAVPCTRYVISQTLMTVTHKLLMARVMNVPD